MSDETKYPSQLAERFQVRMPEGLRDRIREAADSNGRSMNAEIVGRLEDSFEEGGVPPLYRQAFVDGVLMGFAVSLLEEEDPIAELKRFAGRRSSTAADETSK